MGPEARAELSFPGSLGLSCGDVLLAAATADSLPLLEQMKHNLSG